MRLPDVLKFAQRLIKMSVAPFSGHDTHLTRYLEYTELGQLALDLDYSRVASISSSEHLCNVLKFDHAKVISLNYPEFDARNLPFPDGHFDACVADQVAEHVEGCDIAFVRECARVVRRGGLFIIS